MTIALVAAALILMLAVLLYAVIQPLYDELTLAENDHIRELEHLNKERQDDFDHEASELRTYGVIRNRLYDDLRHFIDHADATVRCVCGRPIAADETCSCDDETPPSPAELASYVTEALDGHTTTGAFVDALLASIQAGVTS